NYVYAQLRNTDGMGGGDFKLYAAIIAWIGLEQSLHLVALSCALGFATYFALAMFAKNGKVDRKTEIPFAPSIALAGLLLLCFN
ncbi:prepilin peptidase, partial [Vibrio splendidus]